MTASLITMRTAVRGDHAHDCDEDVSPLRLHRCCLRGRPRSRLTGVPPLVAKSMRVLKADRVPVCRG